MKKTYRDCYTLYENSVLVIGNDRIERGFKISEENILVGVYLKDKKDNTVWSGFDKEIILDTSFPYEKATPDITLGVKEPDCLTDGYVYAQIKWEYQDKGIIIEMKVSDNTPFISNTYKIKGEFESENQGKHALDILPISPCELKIDVAVLSTITDDDCNLVNENSYMLLERKEFTGSVFKFTNVETDNAILIVKDAPSLTDSIEPSEATLEAVKNNEIIVSVPKLSEVERDFPEYVNLYGHTVGVGKKSEILKEYKQNYIKFSKATGKTYIMSNTWGGGNKDAAIKDELVRGEIEVGKTLGVDYIQLDDGWQTGLSMNSTFTENGVWGEGYYEDTPDFWKLNKEKFPNGLSMFEESGLKPAFWFSPDLLNNYESYERDINTIYSLYKNYGATHFKMDGIIITNKITENRLIKVISELTEKTEGNITFNFDITNGKRLGYYYCKEYGNLFLENRYAFLWNIYMPHLTLRTVWQLSEYIPTQRLQVEVIDNERKRDGVPDTFLAYYNYDIRYIFAISMVANPLMWMEMCNLSKSNVKKLKEIMDIYKREREAISNSVVGRVGEEPGGVSFTGFKIENGEHGYYILFREMTKNNSYTYDVPFVETEKLYESAKTKITNDGGKLKAEFSEKASFVFLKY